MEPPSIHLQHFYFTRWTHGFDHEPFIDTLGMVMMTTRFDLLHFFILNIFFQTYGTFMISKLGSMIYKYFTGFVDIFQACTF